MIDLHMHSWYSDDGEYSPKELVEKCIEQGIHTMSITDHNCAKANIEALSAARERGISYITGIEIDCIYKDTHFHLLGYGFNPEGEDFRTIEKNIDDQSFHTSLDMLSETQVLGFRITENDMWELSKNRYNPGIWTGEMFAEALLSKPEYFDHPLLHPYRPGGSRSDNPYVNFYWDFYSQGKPCYVKMEYPSINEAIDIIHRNGGIAVLAHPAVNLNFKLNLIDEICSLGIDGIEAFSSYHTHKQAVFYEQKAKAHHLLTTCGSDFHGKTTPAIALGVAAK